MKNLNEKSYDTVINECSDFFKSQGISIVGDGYKEIATNPALFESYVDQLTEGVSADNAAAMAQLMVNSNANILKESSITGIQPISSLSMPVIRKLWPKFALKEALKTETAKTPRFTVTYTAPYMYKGEDAVEKRVYLPRGIDARTYTGLSNDALRKDYTVPHSVELAAGAAAVVDFTYVAGSATGTAALNAEGTATTVTAGTTDGAVVIANTPSAVKSQPLDELVIVSAEYEATAASGEGASAVEATYAAIKIGKRLGVYGNAVYDFAGGQLLVQFDGQSRKATFAAIGKAVKLTVKAGVSTEYNESSYSVGFDIKRQDIDIPTGQHLNAPLPIEALNDMMALYQIDGTKETVDIMTNVFAQKLDLEVLQFLTTSWSNQPSNEAFVGDTVHFPGYSAYYWTFDCKPAAGFAGSPKAWREEIKPVIDHAAQKIKNNTYLQAGMFTIIANPLDVQVLANVDWQFRGGQGGNMDGVDVDYSVGTYVGANAYKVIASTNVPQGKMFIIFTPSSDTQMTYKYYPYSFSTDMGYVDPNRSRTPSIMMTKRHTFHEFMPAIAVIAILHNDGQSYFAQYTNWKDVSAAETGTGSEAYDGRIDGVGTDSNAWGN